jgi:hypothetical protein
MMASAKIEGHKLGVKQGVQARKANEEKQKKHKK